MAEFLDVLALRYFLHVAQFESISKAARQLRVTQPAVSRQIRAMEEFLGVRLLRRQGRSMRLTEAGRALQTQAASIVEHVCMLPDLVLAASREPVGHVAIGVPYAFGDFLVPPVMKRFCSKYPKVRLRIVQGYSGDIADLLSTGRLDIGVLYGRPADPAIALSPLIRHELGLIAPARPLKAVTEPWRAGRSVRLTDIADLPLILPSRNHGLRDLVEDAIAKAGRTLNVVMEVDSPMLARSLVREGLGYMLFAYSGAIRELKARELRFVPLTPPGLQWQLSIGTLRSKPVSLAGEELIREIVAYVTRSLRRHAWRGELMTEQDETERSPSRGAPSGSARGAPQ